MVKTPLNVKLLVVARLTLFIKLPVFFRVLLSSKLFRATTYFDEFFLNTWLFRKCGIH